MPNIYFVVGYFGSGKSEFAVNLAIHDKFAYLCDLDVINPYFRSRQAETILNHYNVRCVSSIEKNTKALDMPLISQEIFDLYERNQHIICDFGGSIDGAKLIRQFQEYSKKEVEILLVINVFRHQTNNVNKIIQTINDIQESAMCKITGLVNNSNILNETDESMLLKGKQIINEVSLVTKIPVLFTCYNEKIQLTNKYPGRLLPLKMLLVSHSLKS